MLFDSSHKYFSYTFSIGTFISVFGSILNIKDGPSGSDTTLGFSLDGIGQQSTDISADQENDQHRGVYNSSSLSVNNHQLNISISFPGNDSVFYLDYLIYDASENSSITNPTTSTIFIDDTSPYLQYSQAGWTLGHGPSFGSVTSEEAVTLNASIAQATTLGANVSLTFFGMYPICVEL